MVMTNEEILTMYRQAKSKKEQIGILADLNVCKSEDIINILVEGGEDKRVLAMLMAQKKRGPRAKKLKPEETKAAEVTTTAAAAPSGVKVVPDVGLTAKMWSVFLSEITRHEVVLTAKDTEIMFGIAKLVSGRIG